MLKVWKDRTSINSLEAIYQKYCRLSASMQIKKSADEGVKEAELLTEKGSNLRENGKLEWDKRFQSTFKTAKIGEIRRNAQVKIHLKKGM